MKQRHLIRRRLLTTAVVVLAIVMALFVALVLGQRALLYFPDTSDPNASANRPVHSTDVSFVTADGLTLNTWLFQPLPGTARNIAVLFCPGNGGNRWSRADIGTDLAALGYTVLLLEYRGYGANPGKPTETGIILDAQAAVQFLHDKGFPSNRLIFAGESLGTGVAVRLATIDQPAGVLLRSPYTSMVDMAKALYPFLPANLVLKDRYETMSYLPQVTAPLMVLAGSADELVPLSQSTAVADAAPNLFRFVVVPGATHNDPIWGGEYFAQQVDTLARAAVPA